MQPNPFDREAADRANSYQRRQSDAQQGDRPRLWNALYANETLENAICTE